VCHDAATGSDLTSFTKTGPRPDPKVIAHRSPATRGEMLVRTAAIVLLTESALAHTVETICTLCASCAVAVERPQVPPILDHVPQHMLDVSLRLQVNPGSWARFCHKARINVKAGCRAELYEVAGPHEDKCVRGSQTKTVVQRNHDAAAS
jgi:hypothetical protein